MPFYIGIGVDTKRAYSKTHRNAYWKSIVSACDYDVHILFDDIDYEFAKQKEIELISLYKRKSDGGTLCNITSGGDGVRGIVHSEEARLKMGEPNKGKTISQWHRQRISESHKGKVVSDNTKKKISEKSIGVNNPMYGKKASDETREKMSKSQPKGEYNKASKLKAEDILNIREMRGSGVSISKIAKHFGVCESNVKSIINKKTWNHI